MISNISIFLQVAFLFAVFAEPPLNQKQENFEGYPPSGWRPAGQAFQLPSIRYLPQEKQVNLSYGPPQKISKNNNNFQHGNLQNIDQAKPNVEYDAPVVSTPNNSNQQRGIENFVDLTYSAPQDTLSVPLNQPAVTYGPPQEETITVASSTTEAGLTTTELPTSTTRMFTKEIENLEEGSGNSAQNDDNDNNQQGIYYIYHPSGLLQKVAYSTQDDPANMAYSAKLKYENVEPIRSPVYTYDPDTFTFRKLYK